MVVCSVQMGTDKQSAIDGQSTFYNILVEFYLYTNANAVF